jgi:hypothetical protein
VLANAAHVKNVPGRKTEYGQEESSKSSRDQKHAQTIEQKPSASPSVVIVNSVEQQPTNNQGDGTENHSKSYLSRLISPSPENLPNIGLLIAGIVGIIVANCTLVTPRRQTKAALIAAGSALMQSDHLVASERAWITVTPSDRSPKLYPAWEMNSHFRLPAL